MPASTSPRFGEVWAYEGTIWLFLAPAVETARYLPPRWSVLYLGSETGSPTEAASLMRARIREGRSVLDQMWGPDNVSVAAKWRRLEAPR